MIKLNPKKSDIYSLKKTTIILRKNDIFSIKKEKEVV